MEKFWTFERNGKTHTITCADNGGGVRIQADGRTVQATQKLSKHGPQYVFKVNRHACSIYQRTDADRTRYVLTVDGQKISSGRKQSVKVDFSNADNAAVFSRRNREVAHRAALRNRITDTFPDWSLYFIVAVAMIPLLGEFWGLTFVLMMVGVAGILMFSSLKSLTMSQRVFLSWFVTLVVWFIYLIMVMNSTLPCRVRIF